MIRQTNQTTIQVRQQDAYTTNAGIAVKTICNNSPRSLCKGNISVGHCMPLSTRFKGSRMMSPNISSASCDLDLWPPDPKVGRSCLCPGGRFMPICIEIGQDTGPQRDVQRLDNETERETERYEESYHDTAGCSWSCCVKWTCCWGRRHTWVVPRLAGTFLAHSPRTSQRWRWRTFQLGKPLHHSVKTAITIAMLRDAVMKRPE